MTTVTDESLRNLRSGDRLKYQGVTWTVTDFSTYHDAPYEMEEWCLRSETGKEYYLLYEVDAIADGDERANPATWYIAAEVFNPKIYDPETNRDITLSLGDKMLAQETPYPTLQLYRRVYEFESTTAGMYRGGAEEERDRITWDYWDSAHLWNLAIERWETGALQVYQTRVVYPINFQVLAPGAQHARAPEGPLSTGFGRNLSRARQRHSLVWQQLMAWGLVIVGFFFMMAGI